MNSEEMLRAGCLNRDAAETMQRAASSIADSVQRLKVLLEPGYGNAIHILLDEGLPKIDALCRSLSILDSELKSVAADVDENLAQRLGSLERKVRDFISLHEPIEGFNPQV